MAAQSPRSGGGDGGSPGRRYPTPELQPGDALCWKEHVDSGGVYGIGLQLGSTPPYKVKRIVNILDAEGKSANHRVFVGHFLASIDGVECTQNGLAAVGDLILGELNSTMKLEFTPSDGGGRYNLVALRHVPIRTWETRRGWCEVKPDLKGKSLLADNTIVKALEGIRQHLTASDGRPVDMLRPPNTPLGMGIEFNATEPCRISAVVRGSPAGLAGSLVCGDEVVSIDGTDVSDTNIQQLLRGNDVFGSSTTIRVKRGSQVVSSKVFRASEATISACKKIDTGFQELYSTLKAGNAPAECLKISQGLAENVFKLESERLTAEADLARQLHSQQSHIIDLVNEAARKLHPSNEDDLRENVSSFAFQLDAAKDELQIALQRTGDLESDLHKHEIRSKNTVSCAVHEKALSDCDLLRKQLDDLLSATKLLVDPNLLISAHDEIDTLKSQIHHLKKQAEQMCKKHLLEDAHADIAQLKNDKSRIQKLLEGLISSSEYTRLSEDNNQVKAQLEQLQAHVQALVPRVDLEHAQQEREQSLVDAEKLKVQLQSMVPQKDLEQAQQHLSKSEASREQLLSNLATLQAQFDELSGKDVVPHESLLDAKREAKESDEKVKSLTLDLTQAAKHVEDLQNTLEALHKDNAELTTERDERVIRADFDAARLKVDELQQALVTAQCRLDVLGTECADEKEAKKSLEAELRQAIAKLDDCVSRSQHAVVLAELKVAHDTVVSQEDLISDLNGELGEGKATQTALAAQVETLKTTLSAMAKKTDLQATTLVLSVSY